VTGKFRRLGGAPRVLEHLLLGALTLLGAAWAAEVHHVLHWAFFREQYLALVLALALAAVFLAVKAREGERGDVVPWHDWALALGGLAAGGYVVARYPTIAYQLGVLSWDKVAFGALTIFLVLEATRRVVGWTMVVLALGFIAYAKFAWAFPGLLHAKGSTWERIAVYLYLDTSGLFGLPITVAASIVVAFVLFGQLLYAFGGDRFFTDLALVVMGRYRGGPAKVAVAASSLFGTVSGSAVSNVVMDGPITIPMMRRSGYSPHMASAIEAVASTGGQIMPPVMGVAAFLIAEFLSLPYGEVALAALIPAGLYYLALFAQVDLEAARHGLRGFPRADLPRLAAVLREGWAFVVPLGLVVYTLMIEAWPAAKAGMAGAVTMVVIGGLRRTLTASVLHRALMGTGRILLDIVVITAVAGFVIGVLQLSGLGFKLSLVLVSLAGDSALLLLVITAVVCIVLGMGMPTAVVYVMLAVLVAPGLIQLGVQPLAAHLFLFYFGMLSMITPPVCLATFAAASIGQADFMKAGWAGMRLGIVAYIVPFVFVYHPALVLQGSATEILLATVSACAGVLLLAVGCVGFLFRPLGLVRRALFLAAGLLLIPAPTSAAWLAANVVAILGGALLVVWERLGARAERATGEVVGAAAVPMKEPVP
jgi:TRAP transporter 4TM/12TM fusion protein